MVRARVIFLLDRYVTILQDEILGEDAAALTIIQKGNRTATKFMFQVQIFGANLIL